MSRPYVSVMILCYNYAKTLSKALEACAAQTYRDFEVVMIDNGSTDNTKEVYQQFVLKHPEILTKYVGVFPNQGPTHGWNEGLKFAEGEYVIFNDADDWMDSDCLELLAEVAKSTGADRVVGQYREISANGDVVRERHLPQNSACIMTNMLQGTIFKKSVITDNDLHFIEEDYCIAYDAIWIYMFASREKTPGVILRKTVYNYYFNEASITQGMQKASEWHKDYVNVFLPFIQWTTYCMNQTESTKLQEQMEFLLLRGIYSTMIGYYRTIPKREADVAHDTLKAALKKYLPSYFSNSLLRPVGNGYEIKTSFGTWAAVELDKIGKLHLLAR